MGLPTIFGYSGAIADVRVTCADGVEHDCLQKIYRVGSEIAMSFAGSVKIGFSMLHYIEGTLAYSTHSESQAPLEPGQLCLCDGREVAKWLRKKREECGRLQAGLRKRDTAT